MEINFNELKKYISDKGFYYSDELLYNILISLKTKPFLIFSGISGSGKTKVIDLIAEYCSVYMNYSNNYELIPVKPNWTDNKGLIGYHNIIDNTYSVTPMIELFLRALENQSKPYFLILDEMNLAKVEHYFSDILSIIESRKYKSVHSKILKINEEIVDFYKLENKNVTLSDIIIMSGMDINKGDYVTIQELRESPISKRFEEINNKGDEKHYKAQYRTELNQSGKRVANRFFVNNGTREGKYKLKDVNDLNKIDREKYLELLKQYKALMNLLIEEEYLQSLKDGKFISQETIRLHNSVQSLHTTIITENHESNDKENNRSVSNVSLTENNIKIPSKIVIPTNVYIIGTVNIDETTYMFSPKVLDRANVIEFNKIDLKKTFGYNKGSSQNYTDKNINLNSIDISIELPESSNTKWVIENHIDIFDTLFEIFKVLEEENRHFGYRVFNEVSLYLKNYLEYNQDISKGLDNQVLQKILPKINGTTEELEIILEKLENIFNNNNLINSLEKVYEMKKKLNLDGFVTFIK